MSYYFVVETLIESTGLSLVQVTRDEYPLKLGNTKEKAFKTLTLPIQSELQELNASEHYHHMDAQEAFEDVLQEGYMVKRHANGEMEVPYNVFKYVVARREFEDGDKKVLKDGNTNHISSPARKSTPIKPIDVKEDPIMFDTWVRMKPAATDKIVKAVNKQLQLKMYRDRDDVKILDAAPSPYAESALAIASKNPHVLVTATSKSAKVVESISEQVQKQCINNVDVKSLDSSHLASFQDKTFDMVICSFGLAFLQSPQQALQELRRVLKPGGSLFITVWEDLSLSQLTRYIIDEMRAEGNSMEDFAVYDDTAMSVIHSLQPYTKPHSLEELISSSGFSLDRVDHEAARILLSDANNSCDLGVNVASLPIRPLLKELEEQGQNKDIDVRDAFKRLLKDPSLVSHDKQGNLITTLPSRFKLAIATRPHEDSDGYLEKEKLNRLKCGSKKTFKFNDIPK
jgi:ubiquinone/menaquinone biosynthesis C-methylase UbiE